MTQTQQIRDALAGGKLTLTELMEKTGLQGRGSLISICQYLQTKGEISIDRSGDEPVIAKAGGKDRRAALDRDAIRRKPQRFPGNKSNRRPPTPRGANKKAPRKRRSKTLRQIAERITQRTPLKSLATEQLIAASRLLRQAIEDQVTGLEKNLLLTGAMKNCERAEQLAEAA